MAACLYEQSGAGSALPAGRETVSLTAYQRRGAMTVKHFIIGYLMVTIATAPLFVLWAGIIIYALR